MVLKCSTDIIDPRMQNRSSPSWKHFLRCIRSLSQKGSRSGMCVRVLAG